MLTTMQRWPYDRRLHSGAISNLLRHALPDSKHAPLAMLVACALSAFGVTHCVARQCSQHTNIGLYLILIFNASRVDYYIVLI